jgi:hypothetical protein
MRTRAARSALLALALPILLALSAGTVAAGGGATIVPDEARPPEPRAGEDIEYGFTVLQHGQTPAAWEDPTLTITNLITGDSASFPSERTGRDGHFVAVVRLEEPGLYSWSVTLRDLMTMTPPVTATVLNADGTQPRIDVAHAFTAIESARRTLGMELREELNGRIDQLDTSYGIVRRQADGLQAAVRLLREERATLAAQVAALEAAPEPAAAAPGLPVIGIVTLAVLGGALAGFAMAWLGTRRDPVRIEPAPAGESLRTA